MCVKSIKADGFGGAVNIARGMEWAVEHGCDAISMSSGMVDAAVDFISKGPFTWQDTQYGDYCP